jgi:hypothetical protein
MAKRASEATSAFLVEANVKSRDTWESSGNGARFL